MVSFDTAATLALVAVLALIVLYNKHRLQFHKFGIFYAAMYRTKAGIQTMDKIAKKHGKWLQKATPWIIGIGFLGMAIVTFDLARSLIQILTQTSTPTVGLVLPFKAKGIFYVPFFYWIISIFIILIIHEGAHGVMARVYNLPVKSSGLVAIGAVVPLIPGAFVEPDEKKLAKASRKKQLAVFAGGPVANIVTGLLFMLLFFTVLTPITNGFYANDGIIVTEMFDGNTPAKTAGIEIGDKITAINGQAITETADFSNVMKDAKPGDPVNIITSNTVYDLTLGENPTNNRPLLGVYVDNQLSNTTWWATIILWFKDLVFWLYLLSLGVGLFNLVPVGPIDGGRMLLTALQHYTHEARAATVWKSVSFVLLGVLITNILLAFV